MLPGEHIAVVTKTPTLYGRYRGWEFRDTLLVLMPGPSVLYILLFRVSLEEKTIAAQVLKTSTGGLNIDACRVTTSLSDAKAMERCNSPGSGRLTGASIGYHKKFKGGQPLDTTKGRWPSNLLLVHHPDCVCEGSKRIKANVEGAGKLWSHYRDKKLDQAKVKKSIIGDKDGFETVPKWSCHPSCPVGLLDKQGVAMGIHSSGHRTVTTPQGNRDFQSNSYAHHGKSGRIGDSGGASRFYPQFKNFSECLDWVTRLINV